MTAGVRIVLVVAMLMGIVWMGQGIGLIPGSFMTGDPAWAVIGALVAGGAAAGLAYGIVRGRPAR